MKARLVTRVTPTIEKWSLCWERRPISLPPPPRYSLLRDLLASKLKSSTSALWDIWTKAFSGSGRKQCPARWHNTQADLQWLHSSRHKDYFTGLLEERAGILIYMDGWMAPLPHGKNLSLSDCLGQGRKETVMGHAPHGRSDVPDWHFPGTRV